MGHHDGATVNNSYAGTWGRTPTPPCNQPSGTRSSLSVGYSRTFGNSEFPQCTVRGGHPHTPV